MPLLLMFDCLWPLWFVLKLQGLYFTIYSFIFSHDLINRFIDLFIIDCYSRIAMPPMKLPMAILDECVGHKIWIVMKSKR